MRFRFLLLINRCFGRVRTRISCCSKPDNLEDERESPSDAMRGAPARPLRVLPRVAWPPCPRRGEGRCHSQRPLLRALAGGVCKALSWRCKCCPPPPQGQGEGRCMCGSSAARSEDCCVQPAEVCQEVLGDD
ncbi:hypothetical protein VPH35_071597 [Triticum aestivum]